MSVELLQVLVKLALFLHLLLLHQQLLCLLLDPERVEGLGYHYHLANNKFHNKYYIITFDNSQKPTIYDSKRIAIHLEHFKCTQKLSSFFWSSVYLKPFQFWYYVGVFAKLNMRLSDSSSKKFCFSNLWNQLNSHGSTQTLINSIVSQQISNIILKSFQLTLSWS